MFIGGVGNPLRERTQWASSFFHLISLSSGLFRLGERFIYKRDHGDAHSDFYDGLKATGEYATLGISL